MHKTWIVLILLTFVIASCLPGQSPEEVQSLIETAVAQTAAAQKQIEESVALTVAAQNALSTPTETPTATPTSTALSFPTLTPSPTVTPIPVNPPSGGGGSGGGGGFTPRDYSCDIVGRRPFDNSEYNGGDKFDVKWTIVNTGTQTWNPGYDVKYFSGPHMATVNLVEIPVQMKPKDKYSIVMDANAPTDKGFQVMTWTVSGDGSAQLCYPYVAIIVR